MSKLHVFDHPLIAHKLSIMRQTKTGSKDFRELLNEIAMLMGYEITRDLPVEDYEIETPLEKMAGKRISGKKLAVVCILRAGLGMVDGILDLIPSAKIGHIGLYRDPDTLQPVEYYCKLPEDISNRVVYVVDPMLATGGSAIDAITQIKARGVKNIKFMCIFASEVGIKLLYEKHPDVKIYAANYAPGPLNENGYIPTAAGDAGDRLCGTVSYKPNKNQ